MKLSEEQAVKLLWELDRIAQDVCTYDYGLPLLNEEAMPLMIAAVQRATDEASGRNAPPARPHLRVEIRDDDGEPD